jgi:hypothetical protein
MRPFKHFAVSTIGGVAIYCLTGSLSSGIAFSLTGCLTDVDHFYDYIKNVGWVFSLKRFNSFFSDTFSSPPGKKLYCFFHAYELAIILLLICFLNKANLTLFFATMGFIVHLLCDQFTNKIFPYSYFLTYRVIKRFDTWSIINVKQPLTNNTTAGPKQG